jgi:hypothetical protein
MKLCILHCGQPKTGTTSLQAYLSANASRLREHGILYPLLGRTEEDRRQHGRLMRELDGVRKPGGAGGWAEAFEDEIEAHPHEVLLLSAEYLFGSLYFAGARGAHDHLVARGYRIETLAWLRDQPEYLNSSYVQQVKNVHEPETFASFAARRSREVNRKGHPSATRFGVLATLGERLPGTHGFRPYAADVRERGIEGDFVLALHAILDRHSFAPGLTAGEMAGWPVPPRANETEGPVLVAAARRVAGELAGGYRKRMLKYVTRGAFDIVRQGVAALGIADGRYSGLTPARYAAIRAGFAATNETFARSVWGREWDEVFPPRDPATLASNDLDDTQDPEGLRQVEAVVAEVLPRIRRAARRAERALETA